jgi:hypothetical protein
VTAQGNTVTDEKVIALLSLSGSAAAASVGALFVIRSPAWQVRGRRFLAKANGLARSQHTSLSRCVALISS